MPNLLRTLAYVSRANRPVDDLALRELCDRAQKFNDTVDVTGILIYDDGIFVQTIEGIGDSLTQVFDRIERDQLHSIVSVFMKDQIERRAYPAWSMIANFNTPAALLKSFLYARRDELKLPFSSNQNDAIMKTIDVVEQGAKAEWLSSIPALKFVS